MGRQDETGRHEGYVVGYVPRRWVPSAAATAIGSSRPVSVLEHYSPGVSLRELGLVDADNEHDVHGIYIVGYACSCGWRSSYREVGTPLEWSPSTVHYSEWLEEMLATKWWKPHIRAEARRTEQLNHGHSANDSVHVALDVPRKVATDLLVFLNALTQGKMPKQPGSAHLGLLELSEELAELLRT
jgi:hypothetical protein